MTLEHVTSHLKNKELTNSTKRDLCSYCSFKIYGGTQQIDTVFHDPIIFYTMTEERKGGVPPCALH